MFFFFFYIIIYLEVSGHLAKENCTPQQAQPLQTSSPYLTLDEDYGENHTTTFPGELKAGLPAIHWPTKHNDGPSIYCTSPSLVFLSLVFFYYSSAFNTIQPSLSWGKLVGAGVECHLAAWIINCRPVCEASLLCVWCGDMQHRGPQVLYLFFWPVHIRVQTQDKQLSPPEVLWYLISLEVYQKGTNRNTGICVISIPFT